MADADGGVQWSLFPKRAQVWVEEKVEGAEAENYVPRSPPPFIPHK